VSENGSGDWKDRWNANGYGLRGQDERRHHDERRRRHRYGRERRKGDRRRASVRTLLLTAAALSAPHAAKIGGGQRLLSPRAMLSSVVGGPEPSVQVNINSFDAVEPRHAYDDIVDEAAARYKIDPQLIKAVMQAESAFNAMAVSPVGALGLMQLMPDVAKELGVTDPMDPRQNIMAGSKYLKQLLDSHKGNVRLALASYNAGPGNVAKYRTIPPFRETRNYVKKVTALLDEADND
jgi:soluble lytic murein transglycosylase-like protein